MKSVNRTFGINGVPNFSLDQASGIFYEEFLRSRLEEYVQLENQGGDVESRKAEIISERIIQKITTQFAKHLKTEDFSNTESLELIQKVFKLQNN